MDSPLSFRQVPRLRAASGLPRSFVIRLQQTVGNRQTQVALGLSVRTAPLLAPDSDSVSLGDRSVVSQPKPAMSDNSPRSWRASLPLCAFGVTLLTLTWLALVHRGRLAIDVGWIVLAALVLAIVMVLAPLARARMRA